MEFIFILILIIFHIFTSKIINKDSAIIISGVILIELIIAIFLLSKDDGFGKLGITLFTPIIVIITYIIGFTIALIYKKENGNIKK